MAGGELLQASHAGSLFEVFSGLVGLQSGRQRAERRDDELSTVICCLAGGEARTNCPGAGRNCGGRSCL